MKIGIIGGGEFIGLHIIKLLKREHQCCVFLFRYNESDISKTKRLINFVREQDVIIHAQATHRGSSETIIKGNVDITLDLVMAIEKAKKKQKIIFISSARAELESVYDLSKRICEVLLRELSEKRKHRVSIFRVANEFGEWSRPFYNSVIATFCYQLVHKKRITINPSKKKIDFVYAGDIARLINKEISKKRKAFFHLAWIKAKNRVTISELAKILYMFAEGKKISSSKFHRNLYNTYTSFAHAK